GPHGGRSAAAGGCLRVRGRGERAVHARGGTTLRGARGGRGVRRRTRGPAFAGPTARGAL
ncbi:MAG: hypothetical protein AVDCRST_MAG02-2469, partial [uncultured Rubrobacteraceae bacterium]